MISDGVKIRAQIDAESVRNVMLVNGGGSVALLALLPSVLGTPLVIAVLCSLSIWLLGLTFAVIHSVLRRKCSLVFERHDMRPPPGCRKLGINPGRPWVCWWSRSCLNAAIVAFVLGGLTMVSISFWHIDVLTGKSETSAQPRAQSSATHNKSLKYVPALRASTRRS
jgi:hypothetical protein